MKVHGDYTVLMVNSNTTLVKVKFPFSTALKNTFIHSNTTLVKVKCYP